MNTETIVANVSIFSSDRIRFVQSLRNNIFSQTPVGSSLRSETSGSPPSASGFSDGKPFALKLIFSEYKYRHIDSLLKSTSG